MTRNSAPAGILWIVATPIGNLDDLSPRASRVLAEVDVVAAEDTRTSRKLMPPRTDRPRWIALHEHNEARTVDQLLDVLADGRSVALLSDAGTPLISDPGYRLVSRAHDRGITVSPVPGPCAAIAALSAAGLATDRFCFEGFLPARNGPRRQRLQSLARATATLIFYVPARDLPEILDDAVDAFGAGRPAAIGRELTKRFETVRRARLDELAEWIAASDDQQRGEAVLMIAGSDNSTATRALDPDALARELAAELPPARAARVLARISGMERRQAFRLVESLRRE